MSDIPLQSRTHGAVLPGGWLRNSTFDLTLILVVTVVAFLSGTVAVVEPNLFRLILVLDLWLLGYHHVVSTFTRLVFDRESFRQYRFLVIQLPIIVILATLGAVWSFGLWILPTTYLYWQWFHYTRQSYGIERMYRRAAPEVAIINDRASKAALYLVPLFGILYRSYQASPTFLGMEVVYLPVSLPVVQIAGVIAGGAFGYWVVTLIVAAKRGLLSGPHTLYQLTHHLVFATGYLLIPDITAGWLLINVWHNMQYIIFVWWFNNKRFKDQVDPEHQLLSTLSQSKSVFAYMFVCFSISTLVYFSLDSGFKLMGEDKALVATLVTTMMINFHHYVVDGVIWKRKKKPATQPTSLQNVESLS